jgi:hypothetical protein
MQHTRFELPDRFVERSVSLGAIIIKERNHGSGNGILLSKHAKRGGRGDWLRAFKETSGTGSSPSFNAESRSEQTVSQRRRKLYGRHLSKSSGP